MVCGISEVKCPSEIKIIGGIFLLPQFRFQSFFICFVGFWLSLSNIHSFIQSDLEYFVFYMFFQLYFFATILLKGPKKLAFKILKTKKGGKGPKWSLSLVEMIFPTKYQRIRTIRTDKRCAILKNITLTI